MSSSKLMRLIDTTGILQAIKRVFDFSDKFTPPSIPLITVV